MKTRLVIEGNSVYEIDEECLECLREQKKQELPDAGRSDSCYTVGRGSRRKGKDEN